MLLRGEAGIGKTALLEYLVDSASDLTVLRAVGVESEMELAFASLHQLCAPLVDRLETLPAPQRDALQVVFGLTAGPPPDRFLVGLGVLSLLSEVAEERPLLCVVDDAQWLDHASAVTLAFVARRLLAEPVGMVFAARDPGDELQHISELEVHGVRDGDARVLLGSVVRFKLDERVRDRILAETRGNPLALLELPRGLTATQLAGGFGLLEAQALSERIEESFVGRLESLPDDARLLLLVAAAEPVGDPLLLWRAAERLGIRPAAADGVEAQGLVTIGERVTFRHPLVRSGVYRSAATEERRAAHLALAEATDREADPDRRAWHLAAAAEGPDEQVAVELERSAGSAQARGGLAAAAAFLQRAVALTHDPERRAERALAAAQVSFQAGAIDQALRLLATAEDGPLDEFQHARVDLVRGQVAFASFGADAAAVLLKAARRLEPFDLELARETYLMAWGSATHVAAWGPLVEICRAIRALPPPPGPPRPIHLLLDGLALLSTDGRAAATPTLKRAAKALADIPVEDVLRWGWVTPAASVAVWDFEELLAISARQVQLVREAGELGALPLRLSMLGLVRMWMGDFAGAASLVAEIDSVSAATGSHFAPLTALRLRALQGRPETSTAIPSAIEQAQEQGLAAPWAHLAAAQPHNGLARYEKAASAARRAAASTFDPWNSLWALPELVEAAARAGDIELARDALGRLAETTQPSGTDLALGIEARCRALLSEGKTAERLYREAIDRLGRGRFRTELARAHLLYGEWLRRERRRIDARRQLRRAHEAFTSMGAEAFAERARRELVATGEKLRKRRDETRDELTPQEEQIARLARDGLTSPEIAAQLFLGTRTVEWHLQKVFGKLGISPAWRSTTPFPSTVTGSPKQKTSRSTGAVCRPPRNGDGSQPTEVTMRSTEVSGMPRPRRSGDHVSRKWVEPLRLGHPRRHETVAALHELLLRVAFYELSRRRPQLGSIRGPEFDDLAHQAADDALVNVLARLGDFRGLSRFTTRAYKFAMFEVSSKVARHAWRRQPPSTKEVSWDRLPDTQAPRPGDRLEQRERLAKLSAAINGLTERQREVFVAIALNDVSIDILAIQLKTNRNAIYKNLFDARRNLRAKMEAAGNPVLDRHAA